jgi:hypothetical protein
MIEQAHSYSPPEVIACIMYGNFLLRKVVGFFLIFVGVIMLICFMPYWMWLSFLGLVLMGVGCYVLIRRC